MQRMKLSRKRTVYKNATLITKYKSTQLDTSTFVVSKFQYKTELKESSRYEELKLKEWGGALQSTFSCTFSIIVWFLALI